MLTLNSRPFKSWTPILDAANKQIAEEPHQVYSLPAHGENIKDLQGNVVISGDSLRYDRTSTPQLMKAKIEAETTKLPLLYGGDTRFLTGGSTTANRMAIQSIAALKSIIARRKGRPFKVLYASAAHGSVLTSLKDVPFAMPEMLKVELAKDGTLLPSSPGALADGLRKHPDTEIFVASTPTMGGMGVKVKSYRRVIDQHNKQQSADVKLHVDEAWKDPNRNTEIAKYEKSALREGADSFGTSLHKTSQGALSETAVVGIATKNQAAIAHFHSSVLPEISTSQSILKLVSADIATGRPTQEQDAFLLKTAGCVTHMRSELSDMQGIHFMNDALELQDADYSMDANKLTFRVAGMDVKALHASLTEHNVLTRLTNGNYITLHLFEPISTDEMKHLTTNIRKAIDSNRSNASSQNDETAEAFMSQHFQPLPQVMTPYEVTHEHEKELVPFEEAVNRINAAPIYIVPPGITALGGAHYGQKLTPKFYDSINMLRAHYPNAYMKGLEDNKLWVVKTPQQLTA